MPLSTARSSWTPWLLWEVRLMLSVLLMSVILLAFTAWKPGWVMGGKVDRSCRQELHVLTYGVPNMVSWVAEPRREQQACFFKV